MRGWLQAALFAALLGGCGPIEYVNQVTREASSQVEAARAVRADKYAPYWYTLAVEYLHKAREEAATADFQAANRFGRRAAEAAAEARTIALREAGEPALTPPTPAPAPAPATGADGEVPPALDADRAEETP